MNFEQYIRQQLQQLRSKPDADAWERLARIQQRRNRWRKFKKYAFLTSPLVAASLLLWWWQQPGAPSVPAVIPIAAEAYTPETVPVLPVSESRNSTVAAVRPVWLRHNSVPLSQQRFLAEDGLTFYDEASSCRVSIPPNALVNARGQPVSGPVDFFFRTYRTVEDMLAADIPMHYSDERGDFFFNSGGMFDVGVSQNGAAVFMRPDATYEVRFSPVKELTNASLFYYNEKENGWDYVSDRAFSNQKEGNAVYDQLNDRPSALPPVSTEQTVAKENRDRASMPSQCLPPVPVWVEEAQPEQVFTKGIQVGMELASGKRNIPQWFARHPGAEDAFFSSVADQGEVVITKANDLGIQFFPQDTRHNYTELEAFSQCYFIQTGDSITPYSEKETSSNASVLDIFKHTSSWKSIVIQPDGGPDCLIRLGGEDGFIRIHARLVSKTPPEQVFNHYLNLRKERLAQLHREIDDLRKFITVAPVFQEEKEWCMTSEEWIVYFNEHRALMRTRYKQAVQNSNNSAPAVARRQLEEWRKKSIQMRRDRAVQLAQTLDPVLQSVAVLRLMGFGLFNCDQIFRLEQKPVYANVTFHSTSGQVLSPASVKMTDYRTRMLLTFAGKGSLPVMPNRRMTVLVVDNKGKIYQLPEQDYAAQSVNIREHIDFVLNDVTDRVRTPEGWADLLQM